MNFSAAPASIQDVLQLISRSATGRTVLETFLPLYHQHKVIIREYPAEIVDRLRAALGEGQPIGAAFLIEDGQGIIYIDGSSPLGVLAPFLVHEMVHSQDRGLWDNQDRPLTRADRDQLLLRAETKAFSTQHRFVQELCARFPEYQQFLSQYSKARVLVDRLTGTDIADLYGFKTA